MFGDGDVQNHDNAYGSISDERIKQDVRDANSQWDDIKAVKVRNFIKKDDVRQYGDDAWEQIGVIAQELEQVSPKLIRHSNPSSADILSDSTFGTIYEVGDDIPEGKEIGDVKVGIEDFNKQIESYGAIADLNTYVRDASNGLRKVLDDIKDNTSNIKVEAESVDLNLSLIQI